MRCGEGILVGTGNWLRFPFLDETGRSPPRGSPTPSDGPPLGGEGGLIAGVPLAPPLLPGLAVMAAVGIFLAFDEGLPTAEEDDGGRDEPLDGSILNLDGLEGTALLTFSAGFVTSFLDFEEKLWDRKLGIVYS